MKLLTEIKNKVDEIKTKIETKNLYEELENRKIELRRENLACTLHIMANYLVADQLERTGILYSPSDPYVQHKVQQLFFEWKDEGIITEYEDFTDETKTWILAYA